jgi:hypothetical protein
MQGRKIKRLFWSLRILFLTLFPVIVCRIKFSGLDKKDLFIKMRSAISSAAIRTVDLGARRIEYILSERRLWPHAPLAFGRVSVAIEQTEIGEGLVELRATTQTLILRIFLGVLYSGIAGSFIENGFSDLKALKILIGLLLITNLSAHIFSPLVYENRLQNLSDRLTSAPNSDSDSGSN